ncbi:MAG: hypothetical protein ACREHF_04805 [Rhizomicrobium sp.]
MTDVPYRMPQAGHRINEFVVGALFASVLVLAGIVSIAQFAYY